MMIYGGPFGLYHKELLKLRNESQNRACNISIVRRISARNTDSK